MNASSLAGTGTSASQRFVIFNVGRMGYVLKPETTFGVMLSGRSVCCLLSSFISTRYCPLGLRGNCVGVRLVITLVVQLAIRIVSRQTGTTLFIISIGGAKVAQGLRICKGGFPRGRLGRAVPARRTVINLTHYCRGFTRPSCQFPANASSGPSVDRW